MTDVRWMIDGYEEWLAREGLGVVGGLAVDLRAVETKPWPRLGANAMVVHSDARGDFANAYLLDITPGGTTNLVHHLYEAVTYVLDGQGSTVLELPGGGRRSFEWQRGSLFALPVNMPYRLFNSSGKQRVRLVFVTNLPMVMKLFRNERFVFEMPFDFSERLGDEKFLRGAGTLFAAGARRQLWETNFVPDVMSFDQLKDLPERGRGNKNINFVLADSTMWAHEASIPPGQYKKAHRHAEGYHIIQLSGTGYSLYWWKDEPPVRVDWHYGLLHTPPRGMWHQHFNLADDEARYIAMAFGSYRYPFFRDGGGTVEETSESQIEYEDEDPSIRRVFDEELARHRARSANIAPPDRPYAGDGNT